jgi:hypothetical protein
LEGGQHVGPSGGVLPVFLVVGKDDHTWPKGKEKSWPSWRRSKLPRWVVGESSISNQIVTNCRMMNFNVSIVKRKSLTVMDIVDASFELVIRPEIIDAHEESFASRHLVALRRVYLAVDL